MNTIKTTQVAQNTFSDGLVMDFNDLVTPSSALTYCLNGTNITYNGNEFVLQNDMGNGRVETAYLPEGYVPIGTKEYGGIVYIASVNPQTGDCQVGSFPSPERNIGTNDYAGVTTNQNLLSELSPGTIIYKQYALGEDPDTNEDLVLNVGDKFMITLNNMDVTSASKLLDACFNVHKVTTEVDENTEVTSWKIHSPKKKAFTLKLMVEDADHNLRDITPLCKRIYDQWENLDSNEQDIHYGDQDQLDELSAKIKQQSGYFLLFDGTYTDPNIPQQVESPQLRNSSNVGESNNITMQDYSGKVSGKLYIVCILNAVDKFEVNWTGLKNEKGGIGETVQLHYGRHLKSTGNSQDWAALSNPTEDNLYYVVLTLNKDENVDSYYIQLCFQVNYYEAQYTYTQTLSASTLRELTTGCLQYITEGVGTYTIHYYPLEDIGFIDYLYTSTSSPSYSISLVQSSSLTIGSDGPYTIGDRDKQFSKTITSAGVSLPATISVNVDTDTNNKPVFSFPYLYVGDDANYEAIVLNRFYPEDGNSYVFTFAITKDVALTQEYQDVTYTYGNEQNSLFNITEDNTNHYLQMSIDESWLTNYQSNCTIAFVGCKKIVYEVINESYDYPITFKPLYGANQGRITYEKEELEIYDPPTYQFVTTADETPLLLQDGVFVDANNTSYDCSDVTVIVKDTLKSQSVDVYLYRNGALYITIPVSCTLSEDRSYTFGTAPLTSADRSGVYTLRTKSIYSQLSDASSQFIVLAIEQGIYTPYGTLAVDYYYNCPDGYMPNKSAFPSNWSDFSNIYESYYGDPQYYYGDGTKTLMGAYISFYTASDEKNPVFVDVLPIANNAVSLASSSGQAVDLITSAPEYDIDNNWYHVQQKITYDFSKVLNGGNTYSYEYLSLPKVKYEISPYLNYGVGQMTSQQRTGYIDFKKVGTGSLSITEWKYFVDATTFDVTIKWGIENYLTDDEYVNDIKFNFYLISPDQTFDSPTYTYNVPDKIAYNGSFQEQISFSEEDNMDDKRMYLVSITCTKHTISTGAAADITLGYKWFLFTSLYNDLYQDTKISDFTDYLSLYTMDKLAAKKVPTLQISATNSTFNVSDDKSTPEITEINQRNVDYNLQASFSELAQGTLQLNLQYFYDTAGMPFAYINFNDTEPIIEVEFKDDLDSTEYSGLTKQSLKNNNKYIVKYTYKVNAKSCKGSVDSSSTTSIPAYICYADTLSDSIYIPSLKIWGHSHDTDQTSVLFKGYTDDTTDTPFISRDTNRKGIYDSEDLTVYILNYASGVSNEDTVNTLTSNQNLMGLITSNNSLLGTECFRIDWCQGFTGGGNTYDKYPIQYIYFIRTDITSGNNTEEYKYTAWGPTTKKYATYKDLITNEFSNLAKILVEKPDQLEITNDSGWVISDIDGYKSPLNISVSAKIKVTFQNITYETSWDGGNTKINYNNIVQNCIETAQQKWGDFRLNYSYLTEQMQFNTDAISTLNTEQEVGTLTLDRDNILWSYEDTSLVGKAAFYKLGQGSYVISDNVDTNSLYYLNDNDEPQITTSSSKTQKITKISNSLYRYNITQWYSSIPYLTSGIESEGSIKLSDGEALNTKAGCINVYRRHARCRIVLGKFYKFSDV